MPRARGSKPSQRRSGFSQISRRAEVQPLHLLGEPVRVVAVEPVGDQEHHRALRQHPARPVAVEGVQAAADARAALPVLRLAPGRRSAASTSLRAGARVMLVSRVPKVKAWTCAQPAPLALAEACMKVQEHPRVGRHRAGDVAERDEVRPARAPRPLHQRLDVAARAQRRRIVPRQSATGPRGSTRVRRLAIGCTGRRSLAIARRAAASSAATSARSRGALSSRGRRRSASPRTRPRRPRPPPAPRPSDQRLRRPPLGRRRLRRRVQAAHHRRQQAHHLLEELRIAPEQPEDLGEDRALLAAADEAGLQRAVEVVACRRSPHRLDGADRIDHPARCRPAPRPCAARGRSARCWRARACRPRRSARSRAAIQTGPGTGAAASSRMRFGLRALQARCRPGTSAAPRGCRRSPRRRATASSATRHFAQSIVSATPGFLNRSSSRSRCTKATTSRESASAASGACARGSRARARSRDSRPSGRGSAASARRAPRGCGSR